MSIFGKFFRPTITKTATTDLVTHYGTFCITIYKSADQLEHTILTLGDFTKKQPLVRIHSQCLTGDTLFSKMCDCGDQLQKSFELIAQEGSGIVLYLNQEGRGIGLTGKIKAYALQHTGLDTVTANEALGFVADARDYAVAAAMLRDVGVTTVRVLTNNPDKIEDLGKHGIAVVQRVPLEIPPTKNTTHYLQTKKNKLGHLLNLV